MHEWRHKSAILTRICINSNPESEILKPSTKGGDGSAQTNWLSIAVQGRVISWTGFFPRKEVVRILVPVVPEAKKVNNLQNMWLCWPFFSWNLKLQDSHNLSSFEKSRSGEEIKCTLDALNWLTVRSLELMLVAACMGTKTKFRDSREKQNRKKIN